VEVHELLLGETAFPRVAVKEVATTWLAAGGMEKSLNWIQSRIAELSMGDVIPI
jgi:hypothetical protein